MKYVVILPDGVSDVPLKELGGKTPLEAAKHPNMDWLAREGATGWARTIPSGFSPGSDVGCMSVFGYDPHRYHTGRAPLEAAAQGIMLKDDEVAFRCNTLTVDLEQGTMVDHSAGHIPTEESIELIRTVRERLERPGVRFYAGVSYRHLTVVQGKEFADTACTPPHDILGKPFADYLPSGPGSELLRALMLDSVEILKGHPINQQRLRQGKRPATMIWFWGQGTSTKFPAFNLEYGLRGGCISAVDIVRGIGRLAGLDIIKVPGITGFFDTNYAGKAEHALKALDDGFDFMLVHIESTDEAGHMGDARMKIKAIEDVDRFVVGTIVEGLKQRRAPFAILVVPDHPTSTVLKTHIAEPVPFALYASTGRKTGAGSPAFDESSIKGSTTLFEQGFELMRFFLGQK